MIFEEICVIIADVFSVDESTLEMGTSFVEDLGADSLDLVEIMMAIEEEYDIDQIEEDVVENIKTIGEAVRVIQEIIGE
ncbi:MAG: acyl carrier protein [Clostridia bacterium]